MKCVKDYMMKTLNSVHINDTIDYVIEFMHKTEMTVFPVVDDENNFLGTLCTNTILLNVIPQRFGQISTNMFLFDCDLAIENMKNIKDQEVSKYMSKISDVLLESESMDDIAEIMLRNEEQYVFVVNKNKKLRGYISRADLLFYLLYPKL